MGGVGRPAANWRATAMCCDASAAVGASTTAAASQLALAPTAASASAKADSRCKIGSRNMSVLPEPVCETTRTSRPLTASGIASACTAFGVLTPRRVRPSASASLTCHSSALGADVPQLAGAPRMRAWERCRRSRRRGNGHLALPPTHLLQAAMRTRTFLVSLKLRSVKLSVHVNLLRASAAPAADASPLPPSAKEEGSCWEMTSLPSQKEVRGSRWDTTPLPSQKEVRGRGWDTTPLPSQKEVGSAFSVRKRILKNLGPSVCHLPIERLNRPSRAGCWR